MKQKIIGMMTAWACEKWVKPAIEQAIHYCDDVVVSVAAHHPDLQKYEDNTLAIVQSFGDKIKLVEPKLMGDHIVTKGQTLQKMLEASDYNETGNWIWILDADEFYFEEDVELCKTEIETDLYNSIELPEKFFYINCQNYLKSARRRFKKIIDKNTRFSTANHFGPEEPVKYVETTKGIYHYSWLMNPYLKKDFWNIEYMHTNQRDKVDWIEDTYLTYDLKNPTANPQGPHSFEPDANGFLFKYKEAHPPWVEKYGLHLIEDFRKEYNEIGK
tara:strand:+ start:399 stop:1214 length:816 start_codon:yes stop_codon:yes gene_type:complete